MSLKTRLLYPSVTLDEVRTATLLSGKTILLTGATFGIGEALVRHLFRYKVRLLLVARTMEKLQALKDQSLHHQAEVVIFHCDFYREERITELCAKLSSFRIDYFISNAGKSIARSFEESASRTHDFRRTIAVNYLAPVQLINTLSAGFQQSQTHIVNVSTYNVLMKTPPRWSAYVSSKKAMHSWFEGNIPELKSLGVTVSNVYLPLVESRMKEANESYRHTPAMAMDTAVRIIVRALQPGYDFKPWWHPLLQTLLLLVKPFWNFYWHWQIGKEKRQ